MREQPPTFIVRVARPTIFNMRDQPPTFHVDIQNNGYCSRSRSRIPTETTLDDRVGAIIPVDEGELTRRASVYRVIHIQTRYCRLRPPYQAPCPAPTKLGEGLATWTDRFLGSMDATAQQVLTPPSGGHGAGNVDGLASAQQRSVGRDQSNRPSRSRGHRSRSHSR